MSAILIYLGHLFQINVSQSSYKTFCFVRKGDQKYYTCKNIIFQICFFSRFCVKTNIFVCELISTSLIAREFARFNYSIVNRNFSNDPKRRVRSSRRTGCRRGGPFPSWLRFFQQCLHKRGWSSVTAPS